MPYRRAGFGLLLIALLLYPSDSHADPRWWWNDAFTGGTARTLAYLDIDVVPPVDRWDPPAIFFAWTDTPGMGPRPLYLGASFDGGHTFCTIEAFDVYDTRTLVSIAAAPLHATGFYSIQILHRERFVVTVATNTDVVPVGGTAAQKCAAFQNLVGNFTTTDLDADSGTYLDIVAAQEGTQPPHFHAVWLRFLDVGQVDLIHARDLNGDGSGWEVTANLTPTSPPSQDLHDSRVSADMRHGGPSGTSAVNIAFRDGASGEVLYLRSVDSGTTFSATGAPPAGPPAVVNDISAGFAEGPLALDSGASDDTLPLWHGVLWYETQGTDLVLLLDAQHQSGATTPGPAWQSPEAPVDLAGLEDEGDPAISVFPRKPSGAAPVILAWTDGSPAGYDLYYRGGHLDVSDPSPINLDTFPFVAVRPTDPVVSTNLLLTSCDWEEATGDCISNRTAGRAIKTAMDEELGDVFVVWQDDRNGADEVWFKRSDRYVPPTEPTLIGSCPTPDTRRITVEWPLLAPWEKITRYLMYWGTDPGGPYTDSQEIVNDGSLPDPVSVDLDGLAAGTTYCIIVVPEDEGRNLYPDDFDPAVDWPASPPNERCYTTPVTCGQPCGPFSFSGPTLTTEGDCEIEVAWDAATGDPPVRYEVLRDGSPVVSGLTGTAWTDSSPAWGAIHVYQVRATDACADPGPREGLNDNSPLSTPDDTTPPSVGDPVLTPLGGCDVQVEATVTDACSGPQALVDVLLEGSPVATNVTLPWTDSVPYDGDYRYEVRGRDRAGNTATSTQQVVAVTTCGRCVHRKSLAARDLAGVFEARAPGTDLAFTEPERSTPHACPVLTDWADPDPVLRAGGPPLVFYQVVGSDIGELRVAPDRANETVRITY